MITISRRARPRWSGPITRERHAGLQPVDSGCGRRRGALDICPGYWRGSPTAFLAAADGPTLLVVGLRVVHVGAVLAALVLMFRPAAKAVFRTAACGRVA
ncbi:MAG: hypothetical protein ACRDRH_10145 [Pseudonocardia sp.]